MPRKTSDLDGLAGNHIPTLIIKVQWGRIGRRCGAERTGNSNGLKHTECKQINFYSSLEFTEHLYVL